ncbi:MAG: metallophosphoesterase [Dehalococcoidia bacterium]|nr:metallophosphoesterase [Dehalococcoidia bacterium]
MKDNGATLWSSWIPRRERARIGLISDTHIPQVAEELSPHVGRAFKGVDLILHAGDVYVPSCLDWLERIAPVRAVEMGGAVHFGRDHRVAHKQVIEVQGYAIGLIHDLMLPGMLGEVRPGALQAAFPDSGSLQAALQWVFGARVDIVVFGHTHEALIEAYQGVLLVNPGSPTLPSPAGRPATVAILELTPAGPEARVIEVPRPPLFPQRRPIV